MTAGLVCRKLLSVTAGILHQWPLDSTVESTVKCHSWHPASMTAGLYCWEHGKVSQLAGTWHQWQLDLTVENCKVSQLASCISDSWTQVYKTVKCHGWPDGSLWPHWFIPWVTGAHTSCAWYQRWWVQHWWAMTPVILCCHSCCPSGMKQSWQSWICNQGNI